MTAPRRRINLGFDRFSGAYLWVLFIVVFGVWTPSLFLTSSTLHSVASQEAIAAMLGIAVLVPLVAGAYDLSVGSVINLSTIVVVVLQTSHHWGMWPAIFVAIGVSVVIGVVNGFLVVKLRVNSFIATLGMATVVTAIQEIVSGESQPLPPVSHAWNALTQTKVFGFQIVVLYLIILAFIVWWALEHTPVGRYLYAVGGNPEAARLSGVNVDKWTWVAMIVSSTICGIAGVFYASLTGPSLTFGSSLLLPAFAAAFLGSTQLKPGRFNVWGSMLAIYVLATGVKGLQLVTGKQWLNDMFNGVALVGAVAFAVWRQRVAGSKPMAGSEQRDTTGEPTGPGVAEGTLATALAQDAADASPDTAHTQPAAP
ncbi:MAG: ABC transporter permease [Actinomycetota bacterium]|jgi:ribose transport system permease protein|nr:ABC transporter permease [Actinomycetota bacterium]